MIAGPIVVAIGVGAFVLLTARLCFPARDEEPDPVAGVALLLVAACCVASLLHALAFS